MRAYLPYIIIGLTSGAIYALASLGLVLTYRTSGIFNFAHGAVGMFVTYLFYSLRDHMPTVAAAAIAILVLAPLVGVVLDLLFRRLEGAGAVAAIVASLGLLVALQGLAVVLYGPQPRRMVSFLPTSTYRLLDVNVGIDQTLVVLITVGACLGLLGFFRWTHLGLETRAVVDNRSLTSLCGTRPTTVTRFAWALGCAFAAMSGILFSPFFGLDSILLTFLVVPAFAAAAFGRLRSFAWTAIAAFGLGIAQSVATKVVGEIGSAALRGLPAALPFAALFMLLVFGGNIFKFKEVAASKVRPSSGRQAARGSFPIRLLTVAVAIAAMLPPFLSGSSLLTLTTTVAFGLVFASLTLLIGLSRQLSLCHAVFVVFGATTLAHLQQAGIPYLLALPLAGLALVPVGALLALPAIRLSSLFLGLATFGFGILAQNLLFPSSLAFGVNGVVTIQRPSFLVGDMPFYYFTLMVATLGVVVVELLRVSRLGRVLTALADSPTAVRSVGINPLASRLVAFCMSAFLAALAGGLLGTLVQSVNPTSFDFYQSLIWVTVLVAAGTETLTGVALATVLLITVPAVFTSSSVTQWQPVVFGVGAILLSQRNGLTGLVRGVLVSDESEIGQQTRPRAEHWRMGSQRGAERYWRTTSLEAARAMEKVGR